MPVVIRELHVQVNVDERADSEERPVRDLETNRESLISECVERVMEILKRSEQR